MMMLLDKAGLPDARKSGRAQLSPKGVRKIGQLALRDIYQGLLRDRPGGHQADHRGLPEVRPDETRAYQYGDPLNLDLVRHPEEGAGAQDRHAAASCARTTSRSTTPTSPPARRPCCCST